MSHWLAKHTHTHTHKQKQHKNKTKKLQNDTQCVDDTLISCAMDMQNSTYNNLKYTNQDCVNLFLDASCLSNTPSLSYNSLLSQTNTITN